MTEKEVERPLGDGPNGRLTPREEKILDKFFPMKKDWNWKKSPSKPR